MATKARAAEVTGSTWFVFYHRGVDPTPELSIVPVVYFYLFPAWYSQVGQVELIVRNLGATQEMQV